MTIILASRSPRREQLLTSAGLSLCISPVAVDESLLPNEAALPYVKRVARAKALAATDSGTLPAGASALIAADTVVVLAGTVLGKPSSRAEAAAMLHSLAGKAHLVHTAWVVLGVADKREGVTTTEVGFRPLRQIEIEHYLDSGEAFDKAGAYGIQGEGGALVDEVRGSYTNVVGLPLKQVLTALNQVRGSHTEGWT